MIWGLRIARLTMMTHVCLCFRARSVDPFTKKDWYDIKAPSMFSVRNIGKTLVSRTAGTKVRDSSSAIARVLVKTLERRARATRVCVGAY